MELSNLDYNVDTITAANLSRLTSEVASPELAVQSSSFLVRAVGKKYETFLALSQVVDNGEDMLRTMLRNQSTRSEFEEIIASMNGLEAVLQTIFGQSGQAECNTPRYSGLNVLNAVNNAPAYKNISTDTRLLTAACLNDMLDVFGMRQESASSSWVVTHAEELSPTMEDVVNELLEVSIADKIKHALISFRKKVKDDLPKKRFTIFAYVQQMHVTLREIALALNNVSYRESWIRDVFQLVARHIVNDTNQIATYGDPRSNTAIHALLTNSTLVRLAMEGYDKDHICSIPAHEVRTEADSITRNLSSLNNWSVETNAANVVQLSGYRRTQTGALVSAIINGVRKSSPDAHVYTVIDHGNLGTDFVDIINRTKEYKARIPNAPSGFVDTLLNDTIFVAEEIASSTLKTKFTSMSLATANVPDALLHDVVATMCSVNYEKSGQGYKTVYNVIDMDDRLRAISPSNFSHMQLNSAKLAFAAIAPLQERVTSKPAFAGEALIMDGRFTGAWADRNTTPISEVSIVINDLLNDGAKDKSVGQVLVPIFGSAASVPKFTEVSATKGWVDIVTLLNNIGRTLNTAGSQKTKLQRANWMTSVVTQLANWANTDVSLHSIIGRAVSAFSNKAQDANLPEEFFMDHSFYHGMIALQCTLGLIEAMAKLHTSGVEISEEVVELLSSTEAMLTFSHLVAPK